MRHAIFHPAKQLVAVRAQHAATLACDVVMVKVQPANTASNRLLVLPADRASPMLAVQDRQIFIMRYANGPIAVSPLSLALA